jgi:hypothetical protein
MFELIGFCGKKQVGKDTAGQYLVEKYGYNRIGLADAVKEAYYKLNPWVFVSDEDYDKLHLNLIDDKGWTTIPDDVYSHFFKVVDLVEQLGWELAKEIPEVREGLQKMGTECGREIHGEDCWLKIAERKRTGKDVVTDIRFDNEGQWSLELGGYNINISRDNGESSDSHASEAGVHSEFWHAHVENDGTIEELHDELDKII